MKAAATLAFVAATHATTQGPSCAGTDTAGQIMGQTDLTGKVALVTGGDSGLGLVVATELAKAGATVAIAGHNPTKTAAAAANITQAAQAAGSSGSAKGFAVDFGSLESTRQLAKEINGYKSLNYLFNNAGIAPGIFSGGANITATQDGFESVTQIDVMGPLLLTEELLPLMRKTGGARIVNTASIAHEMACQGVGEGAMQQTDSCLRYRDLRYLTGNMSNMPPVGLTYGVAKFGNILHAQALAANENPDEVQAFSVCPGYALTDIVPPGFKPEDGCAMLAPLNISQEVCPYTAEQGAAVHIATLLHATENGGWYQRWSNCANKRPVDMQGFTDDLLQPWYQEMRRLVGAPSDTVIV